MWKHAQTIPKAITYLQLLINFETLRLGTNVSEGYKSMSTLQVHHRADAGVCM